MSVIVRQKPSYTDVSGKGAIVIVNEGGKPTETTVVEVTAGEGTVTMARRQARMCSSRAPSLPKAEPQSSS